MINWRYVVNVKPTVKILSIFVAFLENINSNEIELEFLIFLHFWIIKGVFFLTTVFLQIVSSFE